MKATATTLPQAVPAEKSWVAVYADLFKARLTLLVLLTTMLGFYLGFRGPIDFALMLHTVLGTALVACGGAALNQLFERDYDAKMRRTEDRPLPSGRMQPQTVSLVGWSCAFLGAAYLWLTVSTLTAAIGGLTFVIYVFIYTPLKRVTWLNTLVGAVPGALPPLIGWTAARGELSVEGFILVAIQAFWQIPHFMAIAWMYRDEYAKAGFKMLPSLDPTGRLTARQSLVHTAALLIVSCLPFAFHLTGPLYLFGALVLGSVFLSFAWQFARELTVTKARHLFYASIFYLPLVLVAMLLDKVKQ